MAAYARQAIARSSSGWTVSGNNATLTTQATFPAATSGSTTATHFGVGSAVSAAGHLYFFGTVTPNITIANGVTPILSTSTAITQASSDGMTDEAATAFLTLVLNNTAWSNVGDASGLQPSATAGSTYLSLHTATPAESGSQTTNEVSYS